MKTVLNVEQNYSVLKSTREDWQESNYLLNEYNSVWFTDGSRTAEGVGLGIYSSTCSKYSSLGKNMTVFQAEILAITSCSELLIEQGLAGHKILICSDSLSALNSIRKDKINSRLVGDCCKKLNELGRNNEVVLTWVPGHAGIDGNEEADKLAKKGAENKLIGPEPYTGISLGTVKYGKKEWLNHNFHEHWLTVPRLRQSKKMLKEPSSYRTRILLHLSRRQLRVIVMLLTGHGLFRNHLFNMKLTDERKCRFCEKAIETGIHLLCHCMRFSYHRCILFGNSLIQPEDLYEYPFDDVLLYMKMSGLLKKLTDIDGQY